MDSSKQLDVNEVIGRMVEIEGETEFQKTGKIKSEYIEEYWKLKDRLGELAGAAMNKR